jgi:hypothetical protein
MLLVDVALGHARIQYLEPLLALAAADDLADPRRQYVHCRDNAALSERSANAISGSSIQNSARWRLMFEFSARNVGPKV